jgi:ABC-type Mn2+/Zn2+ transport system permease subunit
VAIVGGVAGAFSFFLLATIVVFYIQPSPSQMQQNSICTFLWSHLAFGFFHIYLIAERQVCTCIKFVFGNMSDWARKKPELWMEKLFIWERCKGKGRKGIDDVVFLCSFSL